MNWRCSAGPAELLNDKFAGYWPAGKKFAAGPGAAVRFAVCPAARAPPAGATFSHTEEFPRLQLRGDVPALVSEKDLAMNGPPICPAQAGAVIGETRRS